MAINVTKVFDVTKALATQAGQQLKDFISYCSDALEQLISELRNGLTFQSNFNCQVKTVSLTHNTAQVVSVSKRVTGILVTGVLSTSVGLATTAWYYDDEGNFTLKVTFSSDPGEALDVTVILLF
jgi:hypothetical protein